MHTSQRFYITHELLRRPVNVASFSKEAARKAGVKCWPTQGQDPRATHTIRLHFYGQEPLALSPLFYHLDLSNNSEPIKGRDKTGHSITAVSPFLSPLQVVLTLVTVE